MVQQEPFLLDYPFVLDLHRRLIPEEPHAAYLPSIIMVISPLF